MQQKLSPRLSHGLIWLNLIYHTVTGLIFYSKSCVTFYLLFIKIFIFISQLKEVVQGQQALISNYFFFFFL